MKKRSIRTGILFALLTPVLLICAENPIYAATTQTAGSATVSYHVDPAYQVTIVTTQEHHVVHGQSGLNLLAHQRLADLDPTVERDTIMVTGRGASEDEGARVADWLRLAAPQARRVVAVCGGALLLAGAGLLDGRRATTHWRLLDTLKKRYPAVRVERGPIYVEDGPVWTSAGASSGFDLTLALVEDDHGYTLARDVAQDAHDSDRRLAVRRHVGSDDDGLGAGTQRPRHRHR